jgi:hypothetical protein
MKPITGLVWLGALAAFGSLTLNTALAQGRGPAGRPALNALSTTVYGTQITPTNAGPIAGRRAFAINPGFATAPVPGNVGTNSINSTMSLMRNAPYGGSAAGIVPSTVGVPQYNGTGNATGLLRTPSFSSGFPGPLMIPDSLGNPTLQNAPNGATPNGAAGNQAANLFDVRSLSAYGDLQGDSQQSSPPASSPAGNRASRGNIPPMWPAGAGFDVHSLSAYGDLERAEQQGVQPGIAPPRTAQPRGGRQPAARNQAPTGTTGQRGTQPPSP